MSETNTDSPLPRGGRPISAQDVDFRSVAVPAAEVPRLAPAQLQSPPAPKQRINVLLCLLTLVAAAAAASRLAEAHGWWSAPEFVGRIGALVATWAAIVLLARRCGGRYLIIGAFSGGVLALVGSFPEHWALAGAAVVGASAFGVLAMLLTRPAHGLAVLGELLLSAFIGLVGAVVVTGYDVVLRPYRFRVLVLGLVLVGSFVIAWRLGRGAKSLGRRGAALIFAGVLVLVLSLAYVQAVRSWGSPGVTQSMADFKTWLSGTLGAPPRPIEALVGFPALIWGVAIRHRRRQGWWMCAFGALGAAGVTSSLIQPTTPFAESMESTGYNVLIGAVLGLALLLLDRLLTGGRGRRARSRRDVDPERPEPRRFASLL